jgi:hypothetical protein
MVVTGAIWIAKAQSERRDRDRRDRDRNGERSRDRERERSPERRVETSTNAAPVTTQERDVAPIENVLTNTGPVEPFSYDAFRIVAQRNIFDPNRRARSTTAEAPPERPKRTEAFTLLGSIAYEKGDFAFFEGTSSDYRKSVKTGDSIGGLKIAEVAPNHVTFEAGEGKTLQLPIGSQMKRVEGEEWKVNSRLESFSSSNSLTESTNSGASSGSGEVSEVLKRLLEKAKKGE